MRSDQPMEFSCSSCRQPLSAPPELFGQNVTCPGCNTTLAVPTPATAAPVVSRGVPGPRPNTGYVAASQPSWIKRHGLKAAVGVVVILIGLSKFTNFLGSEKIGDGPRISRSEITKAEAATKTIISKKLKSPSTAVYSDFRIVKTSPPFFQTAINVDSQNGFGATIRSCFVCVFEMREGDQFFYRDGLALDQLESMDQLDHADETTERVLMLHRAQNRWQPAEIEESGGSARSEPKREQPEASSKAVMSDGEGKSASNAQNSPGNESAGQAGDKGAIAPTDDVVHRGLGFFNSEYETAEFRRGAMLMSNGDGLRPARTLVFPVKMEGNQQTFYFSRNEFGDWMVQIEAIERLVEVPKPGSHSSVPPNDSGVAVAGSQAETAQHPAPPSQAVADSGKITRAADNRMLESAVKALADTEAKIAAEKKRWSDATAVINRLTNNKRTPVQEGTQAYFQCLEASKIVQEVEQGAAGLKAEKARLESEIADLKKTP